jgi:hypothetical protein
VAYQGRAQPISWSVTASLTTSRSAILVLKQKTLITAVWLYDTELVGGMGTTVFEFADAATGGTVLATTNTDTDTGPDQFVAIPLSTSAKPLIAAGASLFAKARASVTAKFIIEGVQLP